MTCQNCGFQNAPDAQTCASCGHDLAAGGPGEQPLSSTLTPVPPPSAYGSDYYWQAGTQRCERCGTLNELSRTKCLNCKAPLKRAGTTTGTALAVAAQRAERRREMRTIGYALAGVILFVLFAAVAFVVFGGLNAIVSPPSVLPSGTLSAANPSVTPSAGPSAQPSRLIPTNIPPTALASFLPLPTAFESLPIDTTPPVTVPPASVTPATIPPGSVPPATVPPVGAFVCAPTTLNATSPGGWQIYQAQWSRKGDWDSLAFQMNPTSSASTASVGANILASDQVEATYGIAGPSSGNVAVVLAFNDAVGLTGPFQAHIGYRALQDFQVTRKSGLVYAVIGVNGSGCYGLTSDAWTTASSTAPQLVVSLQR